MSSKRYSKFVFYAKKNDQIVGFLPYDVIHLEVFYNVIIEFDK